MAPSRMCQRSKNQARTCKKWGNFALNLNNDHIISSMNYHCYVPGTLLCKQNSFIITTCFIDRQQSLR